MSTFIKNGIEYRDVGNGEVEVVSYAEPGQRPGYLPPNPRRVAEKQAEADRRATQDARADEDQQMQRKNQARADRTEARASRPAPGEGLMWGPDGQSVTFIPGGVRDPSSPYYKTSGRPLGREGEKLSGQVDQYDLLKTAAMNYKPDFAGNSIGGEMENWGQGLFGSGTPGQREWWSNFRSFDNLYRNELFGASLTDGEKQAYAETTVNPSMDPEQVRMNVNRRAEIIRSSLERRTDRLRAGGYNEDEVQASVGEFAADLGINIPLAQSAPEFSVPNAEQRDDDPLAAAGVPGGPPTADQSTQYLGDAPANQPGGFVPYGQEYKTVDNPALAGVNALLGKMVADGVPRAQIMAFAADRGVSLASDTKFGNETPDGRKWIKQNPGRPYPVNVDDMQVPLSGMQQFANNAPQTRLGTMAATALNAGGMGIPQMVAGGEGLDYLRSQNPGFAFAGDVGGVIGGTSLIGRLGGEAIKRLAPSLLTRGGSKGDFGRQLLTDASYGAIYGGTTEGDPLTGALTAGVGSAGGQVIGGGIKRGLTGITDEGTQYLSKRGIPLTMGQLFGNRSIFGKTMNKLESTPVVGDMLGARRVDGLQAFEREALKDVVAPVGGNVTMGGKQGLIQAQNAVDQGYRDALSGVNVRPDQQFIQDAGTAMQVGGAVPKFGDDFTYAMNQELSPLFGQTGNLGGPQIQSALQSVGKVRAGFDKNPDAMASYAANATNQMDDAISDLVGRQAPDVMPAYNNAKSAFSNLVPFENARIGAVNQNAITPAQLQRAVTSNTKNYGGRGAAARGDNLTDLMKFGQEILPSSAPNPSGTASHVLMSAALPAALGGASYGLSDMTPGSAGLLATLAAMSTKTGQKALQTALTKERSAGVKTSAGIFGGRKARRAIGGALTAPMLIE